MDENKALNLSLTEAVRAARIREAERTGVVVDLRDAERARLEILADLVKPVFAEIPAGIDLFDTGLVPGATPRFFVDMIAFVEMGRDKRTYRFLQDTRHGRRVIVESTDAATVAERITAYVAERLVARERMLAEVPERTDGAWATPTAPVADRGDAPAAPAIAAVPAELPDEPAEAPVPAAPSRESVRFTGFGGFVLFVLGLAAGIAGVFGVAEIAARF